MKRIIVLTFKDKKQRYYRHLKAFEDLHPKYWEKHKYAIQESLSRKKTAYIDNLNKIKIERKNVL